MRAIEISVRYGLLAALCIGGIFACDFKGEKPTNLSEQHPNVIFLLLDAARADHFSCYGYLKETTPRMDEIAESGAVFLDCYSQTDFTSLSISQIFNSRYFPKAVSCAGLFAEWALDVYSNSSELFIDTSDYVSLTAALKNEGYKTYFFSAHPLFCRKTEMVKEFDHFYDLTGTSRSYSAANAETVINNVIDLLKEPAESPFFVYVHLVDTHFPHYPKLEHKRFIPADFNWRKEFKKGGIPLRARGTSLDELSEEGQEYLTALYDEDMYYTDMHVGRLYDFLKENNLDRKTLLVISSDHGEMLGKHGYFQHSIVTAGFEDLYHIPLIFHLPGVVPEGVQVEGLIGAIDIYPTIVSLCDVPLPTGAAIEGRSYKNLIFGSGEGRSRVFLGPQYAIRTNRYKYFYDIRKKKKYLFDLFSDPEEENNLIDVKPDLALHLKRELDLFLQKQKSKKRMKADKILKDPFGLLLNVTNSNAIEKSTTLDRRVSCWKDKPTTRGRWIYHEGKKILVARGSEGTEGIDIANRVPNGKYRISLISYHSPDLFGHEASSMRVALNKGPEVCIKTTGEQLLSDEPTGYEYLFAGEVEVKDNTFQMSISPSLGSEWAIVSFFIRFDPIDPEDHVDESLRKDQIQRLKALGYLQ